MPIAVKEIRALCFKDPFAYLVGAGYKQETRTWDTKYRGYVLICSTMKPYNRKNLLSISGKFQFSRITDLLGEPPFSLHRGRALAVGKLYDTRPMTKDDENLTFTKYSPNKFIHLYDEIRSIVPFVYKGHQGWKKLDNSTILQLTSAHNGRPIFEIAGKKRILE